MSLSAAEARFIEKREKLTKHWPVFGVASLLLLAMLALWLWFKTPHMINPWLVVAGIENGTLPETTVILMGAMLPMVMLALLVFTSAFILLAFKAFSNERRLIQLLRRECPGTGVNESQQ